MWAQDSMLARLGFNKGSCSSLRPQPEDSTVDWRYFFGKYEKDNHLALLLIITLFIIVDKSSYLYHNNKF